MSSKKQRRYFLRSAVFATAWLLCVGSDARVPISGTTDVNVSNQPGNDEMECTISQSPTEPQRLFVACNTLSSGLFAASSENDGVDWSRRTILDRDPGEVPSACCDPSSTWDKFGHLFLAYISKSRSEIVVIMSEDGGKNFQKLAEFPGSVDQPTIVAANTTAADAPVAVWVVWNQGGAEFGKNKKGDSWMVASGAKVTDFGRPGVGSFTAPRRIPGTEKCSFGDVAIAPDGALVQACQSPVGGDGPSTILVNTIPRPFDSGEFPNDQPVVAAQTNVGGFDFIPAQRVVSVDAEAGLAFDQSGRLYLVYTDAVGPQSDDLDVWVRTSNDEGKSWTKPAVRVNDDVSGMSQFLPRIAFDDAPGNVAVCWYDCRRSTPDPDPTRPTLNRKTDLFCSTAPAADVPKFSSNVQISGTISISRGTGWEYGDYAGLVSRGGVIRPVWAVGTDVWKSPTWSSTFDAMTDRVTEEAENPNPTPPPPAIQQGGRKPTRTPRPHRGGGH